MISPVVAFASSPLPAPLLFGIPSGWEAIIILLVILLLFGRKLPTMARSLGQSFTEFKKGLREEDAAGELSEGTAQDGSAKE